MKNPPEGYHTITPSIIVRDAIGAIELYQKALGATLQMCLPDPSSGKVMHACMTLGDSVIFIADAMPEKQVNAPKEGEVSPAGLFLYVEDAHAAQQQAIEAGFKELMPVQEMFWGDNMGVALDPYGYKWNFATNIKRVSKDDIDAHMNSLANSTQ